MDSTAHVFLYSLHSVNKLFHIPSVLTWVWYRAILFRMQKQWKTQFLPLTRLHLGWEMSDWYMKQLGEKTGGVKSSVRVLGSACKPHRNSEARTITGGKKSNSSPFERDCKKPLFLSQMSAGNSGSYHPGKDWKQHYVIFHTFPGPIQHSTLWKQHTHHPEKEIKHGLLKVLK